MIDFSDQPQTVTFEDTLYRGRHVEYLRGNAVEFDASGRLKLEPWAIAFSCGDSFELAIRLMRKPINACSWLDDVHAHA